MSKSIHDYKNEIDSVKISDSFIKRTEQMMTEQPSILINKKPAISWQKTTAILGTAAACVTLLFAMNERRTNSTEVNDMVAETFICETNSDIKYADFSDDDEVQMYEDVNIGEIDMDMVVALEDEDDAFNELNIVVSNDAGDVKTTTSAKVTESKTKKNTDATTKEEDKTIKTENSSSGGLQAVNPIDVPENAYENYMIVGAVTTESVSDMFPFFIDDVDYNTSDIGIVSYINDNTKPLKTIYTNLDAQQLALGIKNIIFNAKTTNRKSSKEIFYITVNTNSEDNYFQMSLTENKQFTVICNYPDGSQTVTYQLNDDEYTKMEQLLYLVFSSQGEYEEYSALNSGK